MYGKSRTFALELKTIITMDKAIFQFNKATFQEDEVMAFSRDLCERLTNTMEIDVVKYNITNDSELEEVINRYLDSDSNYYRVFLSE